MHDPEIDQLDLLGIPAADDHHVRRLDVPMDDVVAMGEIQRFAKLAGDLDASLDIAVRLVFHETGEIDAVQELHDEKRAPVELAVIVDLDDVRVVEVGDVLDFVLEPRARILVPRELLR